MLVAVAAALGILVLAGATVSLSSKLSRSRADVSRQASMVATITNELRDSSARNTSLTAANGGLQAQLQGLQAKVTRTVGDLSHPHFVLWNSCGASGPTAGCPLVPGREYVGSVPDTFTYLVSFRSTVPVTLWIMTTSNFVCWETHGCAWRAWGWQDRTNLVAGVFHGAEGCAGYIAVFSSKQAGTLYPDVSVTRKPAARATGACA